MSYLEEYQQIEGMITRHNVSKSTVISPEKQQAMALLHIAKCLSRLVDLEEEWIERTKFPKPLTEEEMSLYSVEKKVIGKCSNCIYNNEESGLHCDYCTDDYSNYEAIK